MLDILTYMFDKNDSLRQTYQFPMKKFAMLKAINRILLMKIKIKDVHMMKVHYEMIENPHQLDLLVFET